MWWVTPEESCQVKLAATLLPSVSDVRDAMTMAPSPLVESMAT